jgi:hypothetical protein
MPSASIVLAGAAGQFMMNRALATELLGADVRIRKLAVNGPIDTRQSAAFTDPACITAESGGVVAELGRDGRTSWPPALA